MTITDLGKERARREQPDPQFVKHDDFGRPMYLYLLQYEFEGHKWGGVDVWAYSTEDAERRVAAMRESLVLVGQCMGSVPA